MIRTILLLSLVACGSKQPVPATPPASNEHAMGGEHHEMAPELTKFHDLLAPRWHAAKGEPRTKDTCDAVPQFQTEADAIAKAPPPKATAEGARALIEAVGGLETACTAKDEPKFDAAFEQVHTSFHALMGEGMKHDMKHEGMHHH